MAWLVPRAREPNETRPRQTFARERLELIPFDSHGGVDSRLEDSHAIIPIPFWVRTSELFPLEHQIYPMVRGMG